MREEKERDFCWIPCAKPGGQITSSLRVSLPPSYGLRPISWWNIDKIPEWARSLARYLPILVNGPGCSSGARRQTKW